MYCLIPILVWAKFSPHIYYPYPGWVCSNVPVYTDVSEVYFATSTQPPIKLVHPLPPMHHRPPIREDKSSTTTSTTSTTEKPKIEKFVSSIPNVLK